MLDTCRKSTLEALPVEAVSSKAAVEAGHPPPDVFVSSLEGSMSVQSSPLFDQPCLTIFAFARIFSSVLTGKTPTH
jgi:hypothetical protein